MKDSAKKNSPNNRKRRYSADRPIEKVADDRLGRGVFAQRLADDVIAWDGKDSLVIGLYGDWGVGKTSLKNLVLRELKRRRRKNPVLEFNPWQLSGMGGITGDFFNELGAALGTKADASNETITKAKERLEKYAKRFSLGEKIAKGFGALFMGLGQPDEAGIAVMASEGLKQASEVAEAGSKNIKPAPAPAEIPLSELKRSLGDALRALKRPFLVVIDDIDRLSSSEIREIFQLVKANADFPKLVYLLLFERSVVCKALDNISGSRGNEFLEKIIQVGFHVPHAAVKEVQAVLFKELDDMLSYPGLTRRWNTIRWSEIYLDGLSTYFKNLRHVQRFLASLDFHIRQFQTGAHLEVNPVDLIALEVIRVFEPSVFERLVSAKSILTREANRRSFDKIKQSAVDEAVSQIVSHSSTGLSPQVDRVIRLLFPAIGMGSDDNIDGLVMQDWLRDSRVCHPDLFDRYFTLAIKEGELSQAEFDSLLDSANDAPATIGHLHRFKEKGLLDAAFGHLEAYKEHIPLENMPTLIQGLSEVCDGLPEEIPGLFKPDMLTTAARVVRFGLLRESDGRRRANILTQALERSSGVVLPVKITSWEERNEASPRTFQHLIPEEEWQTLKRISLDKIRLAAAENRLLSYPRASMLLGRWSDWDSDSAKDWITKLLETPGGVFKFLPLLLGEVHAHGREIKTSYYMKLKSVERYFDVDFVKAIIDKSNSEGLGEHEQVAVREFGNMVKRRERGILEGDGPEYPPSDDLY